MKKLIYKVISLCVVVLILIVSLSAIYTKSLKAKNKEYTDMPYKITLANTGNSHGEYAFNYSVYDGTGFNYAMESQSLEYDYNILSYYIDHFAEDGVLLIPISYFSLWSDELKEVSFDDKNMRYFSVLDADHMRFKSKTDYYIGKYFLAVQMADRKINSIFINKAMAVANPQKTDFTMEEIGEKRAAYHLRNVQDDKGLLKINASAEASLISMIKLCKKHNVKPVLVTTPYMHYYSKWFSNDFFKVFNGEISNISDEYNVPYLDYSKDKRFADDEKLFNDTDHLNEDGAKAFTKIVIDDLKKLDLLK